MIRRLLLFCVALAAAGQAACDEAPTGNPASLWISYSGREVDLTLIDHEPPPF